MSEPKVTRVSMFCPYCGAEVKKEIPMNRSVVYCTKCKQYFVSHLIKTTDYSVMTYCIEAWGR